MQIRGGILIALLAASVGGCSREDAEQVSPAAERADGVPADNVFSGQVKSLDKAQDVQKTLDAATARTRESVERQERP